ncbi:spermidine/putrescine ABC transporter ATP-binding subunit [Angulomicrobium tetraedrale]|uniref:Spermidine/putrescine import ATP-binding protein PotA n=1 Tax=Ancylobacter tetraedralis TaxID=217068 RepID=A0A839ZFQ6_9HYPH|nr:ABC transporter ATP-binding protein [Ancylobacter tetraedralis]MBB3773412.1 spermidine/putrescine ABC transporter ATP-binding subunit [Ancylobacter tetraedralis]
MSTTPVIQMKDIVLNYGALTVLHGISVDFNEGEFFALLGPSGCGKTSLLRIMAGFADPTSGQMLLDGKDLIGIPARRRPVNMMFQSYALFPHLSVEQNVRYGLEMARLPADEIRQRVGAILETTHLTDYARRKPNQLSGGQRQRVALARALVMRPRVLLLDEPLGALDKKLREVMQLELKRLQHEMGITFIIVTHDQEEALVMADRIALMRAGQIEQIGTPAELYEMPVSRFVADFVGKTNFFEGVASGGKVSVAGLGELTSTLPASGAVAYSIRPERICVAPAKNDAFENCFQGVIEEVAYHGQDQHILVRLAGQTEPTIARVGAQQPGTRDIGVGAPVWLGWNGADARVLTR